jgi:hypothetical protein
MFRTAVHASRGKYVRAEPISSLYEQNRIHHVGVFERLEDQLTSFVPDMDRGKMGSPDHADAMIWAFHDLLIEREPYAFLIDHYGREVERLRGSVASAPEPLPSPPASESQSPGCSCSDTAEPEAHRRISPLPKIDPKSRPDPEPPPPSPSISDDPQRLFAVPEPNGPFNPEPEYINFTRGKRGSIAFIVNGRRTDE